MSSIVALSTPAGSSALALIRASGPLCEKIFPKLAQNPRKATLVRYEDVHGGLIDQLVATFFAKGHSFTGEAMLELSAHGSPFIVEKIIEDLLARGFELAAPGEFTRRAFENGKLDLTQAEAIAQLVSARSQNALEAAHRLLAGELGSRMTEASEILLSLIAQVEAYIDFPDEDLPAQSPINDQLGQLKEQLQNLRNTSAQHRLTFSGARIVFAGATNAGKSSLFNAFVGHNRAIVSAQAGTTRDYLEVPLTLGRHAVTLIDTAGLNDSPDSIEAEGITHSHHQLETADLILYVIDGAAPFQAPPIELESAKTLFIFNKSDADGFKIESVGGIAADSSAKRFTTSATARTGLDDLRDAIIRHLDKRLGSNDTLMVSARHADSLTHAIDNIELALEKLANADSPEFVAHHLHAALGNLGEILGKFDNERILDKLFGAFCIGK